MSILTLPPEIIEQVLISAAAAGFPHAIAAFAQTSKSNHALVYDTKDQHLWREVFLTTFDDPRASGGGPGWGECVGRGIPTPGNGPRAQAQGRRVRDRVGGDPPKHPCVRRHPLSHQHCAPVSSHHRLLLSSTAGQHVRRACASRAYLELPHLPSASASNRQIGRAHV